MKYIVENWFTEETLAVFDTEEDRQKWLNDNCDYYSDGAYLSDGTRISIYEEG